MGQNMTNEKTDFTLYAQVTAIPGGERMQACLQCGTCGGSCPTGQDMDHSPRELFAMILADKRDEVLRSNTMAYCVSCYYCTVRCPQQIPITDIMYRLKRIALANGHKSYTSAFAKTFVGFVDLFGRGYELGIAMKYYLTNRPFAMFGMLPMAVGMFKRGRMAVLPTRIKDMRGLNAILNQAKAIARQQDRDTGMI